MLTIRLSYADILDRMPDDFPTKRNLVLSMVKNIRMNIDEILFSVRKTKNLVQEYLDIIEIYKDRMYILAELENYEVNEETIIEREAHSMTD